MSRWYYRPKGYFYGLGPIEAPNRKLAWKWWRLYFNIPKGRRLFGELWME